MYRALSLAVTCYIGPRDAFGARCANSRCIARRVGIVRTRGSLTRGEESFRERKVGAGKTKETWSSSLRSRRVPHLRERLWLTESSLSFSLGMIALSDLSRVECFFSCVSSARESGGWIEIDRFFREAPCEDFQILLARLVLTL